MTTNGPADGGYEPGPRDVLRVEMRLVLDNHEGIRAFPPEWEQRGSYDFLYRAGEFLVADRDLDRARALLPGAEPDPEIPLFDGITLLRSDLDVTDELDRVDRVLGPGVVTPNHVFSVCHAKLCPATEPREVVSGSRPWPTVSPIDEGKGVRVAVVDSGFLQEGWAKSWLQSVVADASDIEDPDWWPAKDGFIDPYAGHGTFIAGVIRCLAPGSDVTVEQVLDKAGVVDEAALITQLDQALGKSPDVISFSAGTYTRGNVAPKSFVEFYENRLRHHKGVVLVAAAGNDGERTPFWPAAFPWAVSVGSLDGAGRQRSTFSNHGGWVDVYAPG
jgi:subtilisin family serine protease